MNLVGSINVGRSESFLYIIRATAILAVDTEDGVCLTTIATLCLHFVDSIVKY